MSQDVVQIQTGDTDPPKVIEVTTDTDIVEVPISKVNRSQASQNDSDDSVEEVVDLTAGCKLSHLLNDLLQKLSEYLCSVFLYCSGR